MRILFVCSGNTCRSPMAEILLKEEAFREGLADLQVDSAGLICWGEEPMSRLSSQALVRGGYSGGETFRSKSIDLDNLSDYDWILTMTIGHAQSLLRQRPDIAARVAPLNRIWGLRFSDIEDPFGGPEEAYQRAFEEIQKAVRELVRRIISKKPVIPFGGNPEE